MPALKILVIPGSLRTGSLNRRLAGTIVRELTLADVEVTQLSLADHPLPLYDGDLEVENGVPRNAVNLKRLMGEHDGVVIVTPEYNSAPPPLIKNMIDWITRVQDPHETAGQVFRERPFAIAAASNGRLGGARCLSALRLILSGCRATVIPTQLSLAFADDAYDETDRLKHPADLDVLRAMVRQLIDVAQSMK